MTISHIQSIPLATVESQNIYSKSNASSSGGSKIYYCKILNNESSPPTDASYGSGKVYRIITINPITLENLGYPEAELFVPSLMGKDFLAANRIETCTRIYIKEIDEKTQKVKWKGVFVLTTNPFL